MEERLRPDTDDDAELLFHWHRYQVAAPLTQGRFVLDVGCGDGYGAAHLAEVASDVVAVDVDPAAVDRAAARYAAPGLAFRQASATSLPFSEGTFDVVVAFEVLEHLDLAAQPLFLAECARVLKPDGLLLLSTPDRTRTEDFGDPNPHHLHELTAAELALALTAQFPHVRLWRQELAAGSLLWEPDGVRREGTMWAVALTEDASTPAPPGCDTHLTLVAAAGRQESAVAAVRLDGFLTERSRRLLMRLWGRVGELGESLDAERRALESTTHEVQRLTALSEEWREEREALWRENSLLAERVLTVDRLEEELAEVRATLEQLDAEQPRLRQQAERLAVIEASRGWKLVDRYWRLMDRAAWLQHLRHPFHGPTDPPPPL